MNGIEDPPKEIGPIPVKDTFKLISGILLVSLVALSVLHVDLNNKYVTQGGILAQNDIEDALNFVTGIVLSLEYVTYDDRGCASYIGLLRLTSEDAVNHVEIGEITKYRMNLDTNVDLDVGNLLIGKPVTGDPPTIQVQYFHPFLRPKIINTGEYVDFGSLELNTVGPSLRFSLQNLGEKDIISIRVEVNGTFIPFLTGVDKEHPVKPAGHLGGSVPTSWFDPSLNRTVGFKPERGETYPVVVILTLYDGALIYKSKTVKTYNFSVPTSSRYSIELMVHMDSAISIRSVSLFSTADGEDFISLELKNVYMEELSKFVILVDDVSIANVSSQLGVGGYLSVSMKVPFDIYSGTQHNVVVQAFTAQEYISEVSQDVLCVRK